MIKRLGLLIAGSLAFWVLAGGAAFFVGGDKTLLFSGVAGALCLTATAATLAWTMWGFRQSPEQELVTVLGGTGVRMFFVLGAALGLSQMFPEFQQAGFWVWLLVFYLFTLALEMVLLVSSRSAANEPKG